MVNATLNIQGMSCGHCVQHVETALKKIAGVSSVSVDLAKGKASVAYDPVKTNPQALKKAVDAAGYPATIAS
ncbi:heavy-metal-associated domain-containing protein [Dehalogenimonas etheniformans]|uniref:Copper chaperone CopZ n=1 Tax=Dehalogenimonas etheniformans TaxID=1536648 RepID=A0A2P5P525_9CHLR|nr:copper ion binding protein [Dehalogenimonas etheniformans]PPD57402.1 copper resistance protein CopZ [Dehalogenimonas etheniformans]QNT77189.1 heavy-metal-associated domain-containing protein [Dehalogenimonas etheniformans]